MHNYVEALFFLKKQKKLRDWLFFNAQIFTELTSTNYSNYGCKMIDFKPIFNNHYLLNVKSFTSTFPSYTSNQQYLIWKWG